MTKRFTIETKTTTSRGARRRTWSTYAVKQIDAEGWTLSIGFEHATYAAAKAELDRKVQAAAKQAAVNAEIDAREAAHYEMLDRMGVRS